MCWLQAEGKVTGESVFIPRGGALHVCMDTCTASMYVSIPVSRAPHTCISILQNL